MDAPEQDPGKKTLNKWVALNLALELGFIIALPLVGLALLGKYLDGRLGTEPWLTLAGILLAMVATTVWLTRRFKQMMK